MADAPAQPAKLDFFGLDAAAFDAAVAEWGWPRFRAQQVRDWVYGKLVADPPQMTNLSKRDREVLTGRVSFGSAEVTRQQQSADGTRKLLLTWSEPGRAAPDRDASEPGRAAPDRAGAEPGRAAPDRADTARLFGGSSASAETVMIPDADRRTACVSSQVGCPVGCKFCASGINGVNGNLTAAEIVEQIYQLNILLRPSDERISNVVFMGMGEPLANYANVMQAVRVLHDPKCFNIGARRITISTVGVPPKMRQLAEEKLPLNLAISLHAPNEPLRKQLIPWAEHFALDEILDAARYYFDRTGREITLEYILLSGVNAGSEHARELARLCKTLRANVNLIRYNEVESLPYVRPRAEDVVRFQDILRRAGVNAHVRKSRGRDIDAACGQLRRKEQQKREREQFVILG